MRSRALLPGLVLIAAFATATAWADEDAVKTNRTLGDLGHKINKAVADTDANRVTGRIVEEWSGTKFKFDATGAPRELTTQDVENLRAKKLGFGEISILLALAANQTDATNAKSVNEILSMRQSGTGWGELAKELGYKNLGSVVKSVKAADKNLSRFAAQERENAGKPDKMAKAEKAAKPDKIEKLEKAERPEKLERPNKPERMERPQRPERPGR